MKALLINPPFPIEEQYNKLKNVGMVLPPIGLACIASYLEKNGIDVEILDAIALDISFKRLGKEISRSSPEIIGIPANTPMFSRSLKVAKIAKKALPESLIVLGGPHPSTLPVESLSYPFIDVVVIGEGEQTMLEICKRFDSKKFGNILGIGYKENGKVKINPRRQMINLDSFPMPAWHLLPVRKYRLSPASYRKLPAISMMTSRGCPFRCIYCNKSIFGRTYRMRSPDNVLKEIKFLTENYGIKDIQFWDDVFTMNRERTLKICRLIKEKFPELIWNCETRVDLVDRELLKAMKDSGCYEIGYGVESGSSKILKTIKKDVTIDQVKKAVRITKDSGIDVKLYFMLGLPKETWGDLNRTIDLAIELDPYLVHFSIAIPFPGTEFFKYAKESNRLETEDWERYILYGNPIFRPEDLSIEDVKKAFKMAYKKFYLRMPYMLKFISRIRTFQDIVRLYHATRSIFSVIS